MYSDRQKTLASLREDFTEIKKENMPCTFLYTALPHDPAVLKRNIARKKKNGAFCIIPELIKPGNNTLVRREICDFYKDFFSICESVGIGGVFNLEPGFETLMLDTGVDSLSSDYIRILNMNVYRAYDGEDVKYKLHDGMLMSIVAYNSFSKVIDLREFVKDGFLEWKSERGSHEIYEFTCVPDSESGRINYLDYNTSVDYISSTLRELGGVEFSSLPSSLVGIKYNDVGFVGKNRRTWCEDFNKLFEERFDFDPAPFYPSLFKDIDVDSPRLKAQFNECRSQILKDGFIKAVYDFSCDHELITFGGLIAPKLTSCSQTVGDTVLCSSYAPAALMNKAYLYGINSVKIAAGSAYNFDRPIIDCDLLRDYGDVTLDTAYKDAMHSLARGANRLLIHSPQLEDGNAQSIKKFLFGNDSIVQFSKFVSRVQSVMRGGRHSADIAILYPIYSLHSNMYFYNYSTSDFEYPSTPASADYMSVINSISLYSGHDVTVLHPEGMTKYCHVRNRLLCLDNRGVKEKYNVIVLPGTSVISIKNLELIAEFFDCGGKVIATGCLPTQALESTAERNYDGRVAELSAHIFGENAAGTHFLADYTLNTNENGGMAYLLFHTLTAADGTGMTDDTLLSKALESINAPFEMSFSNMMRFRSTGTLNTEYPVYMKLGLSRHLPGGGMITHLHKKRGDIDIYYIANTTDKVLSTEITLRGNMLLEEWNPHTGRMRKLPSSVKPKEFGESKIPFTTAPIEIPPSRSIILVGYPPQ